MAAVVQTAAQAASAATPGTPTSVSAARAARSFLQPLTASRWVAAAAVARATTPTGTTLASSGAAGGGIIIIRTFGLTGTGTLTANGLSAYNGTATDAGGGGGAGGSIVILSANGGESGLTLQANGGSGGNAWESNPYTLGDRHGPGGGGGGGVVLVSGAPASVALTGGSNGLTETPGVPYGSTPGVNGISVTNATLSQTSGTLSGAQCTPDMTIAKSHVGNFTRGSINASYTLTASNVSSYGPSSGTVTVNDTLPPGVVPTAASGTGWACSLASQTVSCTDATSLAAGASYSPITITASVAQTAPATITNNAIVGGGGEVDLANDTATDIASVISSADLAVTNTASPDPVTAGNNITYTQVLTNNGPSAADNATIVEAVPANTTFVSFTAPSGWNCLTPAVGATGNIVCTDLNMAGSTASCFLAGHKSRSRCSKRHRRHQQHHRELLRQRSQQFEQYRQCQHCSRTRCYSGNGRHQFSDS